MEKKKHSKLSIASIILTLLGCTATIGIIIAIVDLCKKDKTERHVCSYITLAIFGISLILVLTTDTGDVTQTAATTTESAIVQVTETEQSVTEQEKKKSEKKNKKKKQTTEKITEEATTEKLTEEITTEESTTEQKVHYPSTQTYDDAGLKITMTGAEEYWWYSEYREPKEGYKYVKATFTYENNSKIGRSVSIYDYNCYVDNTSYEQAFLGEEDFIATTLSPGRNVTFTVFYEVPMESKLVELEYPDVFGTADVIFYIDLDYDYE